MLCTRPWTDVHIDATGNITPCCQIITDLDSDCIKTTNIDTYKQSDWLSSLKNNLSKDQKDSRCFRCWYKPHSNHSEVVRSSKFSHLHLRVSNVCNFKCRSCSYIHSSTWYQEDIKNGKSRNHIINDSVLDNSTLYGLVIKANKITLAGGEPLFSNTTLNLLNILKANNKTDTDVWMNTNLSTTRLRGFSWKMLFEGLSINLEASLDGFGKQMEYSRSGLNWDKTLRNFTIFREYIKSILTVISIYSVYSLPELYKFADEQELSIDPVFVTFGGKSGNYLSIFSLPHTEKIKIAEYYSSLDNLEIKNRLYKDIIEPLFEKDEYSEELTQKFISYNNRLDSIRGTNFLNTYPQYKDWYKNG